MDDIWHAIAPLFDRPGPQPWCSDSEMISMALALDNQGVIDSLPLPVVQFYLVPGATGDWQAFEAKFGKVPSKKQTIFGFKLHLLITLGGLILDFALAPANASDLEVGFEMLSQPNARF